MLRGMRMNNKITLCCLKAFLLFTVILFFSGCPIEESEDTIARFSVTADGIQDSITTTELTITLTREVGGITAARITLTDENGDEAVDVIKGGVTGAGNIVYKLLVTVNAPGTIYVNIDRDGVETTVRPVTVHVAVVPGPTITYGVTSHTATGAASTGTNTGTTTSFLRFTFSAPVHTLSPGNIVFHRSGTATASRGELTQRLDLDDTGTIWDLGITGVNPGNGGTNGLQLRIYRSPIENVLKTSIRLNRNTNAPITYTVAANGVENTETSTKLILTFSEPPPPFQLTAVTITGSASRGTTPMQGTDNPLVREIPITGVTQGTVSVNITRATGNNTTNQESIETATKTDIPVHEYQPPPPPLHSIVANGSADTTTSTELVVTFFGDPPVGLVNSSLVITTGPDDTGAATRGTRSGSGNVHRWAITDVSQGTITVTIPNVSGVDPSPQTVNVYRTIIPYTVFANGMADTTTTTQLTFAFGETPTGLTADDISVMNGSGQVTVGALTGTGFTRTLAISSVTSQGNVMVQINNPLFVSEGKLVPVYLDISAPITWTVTGSGFPNTTALIFTFSRNPGNIAATHINLTTAPAPAIPGSVTRGAITGTGNTRSLAVSNVTSGQIQAAINFTGVVPGPQTVMVYNY